MKILLNMLGITFITCLRIQAGISDHFIYDRNNRYKLEECETFASIKIVQYYAFSDIGLIQTFVETKKNAVWEPGKKGFSTSIGKDSGETETIYDSFPQENAKLQLRRNSLWIFEAKVTQLYRGSLETNSIFVAMKPTSALKHEELPYNIIRDAIKSELTVGLVRLDELEFKNSFRGLVCYLSNELEFLDISYRSDDETPSPFSKKKTIPEFSDKDYSRIFGTGTPSFCYVARELGVNYKLIANKGSLKMQPTESMLLQTLKEARDKESANQRVDPTVKTPVESGKEQGTAGHP